MKFHDNKLDRRAVLKTVGVAGIGAVTGSGTAVATDFEPDEFCTTATSCSFSGGPHYCCDRIDDAGSLDSVTVTAYLDQAPSSSVGTLKVENDSQEFNCGNIEIYDYVEELDSAATEVYISYPVGQINIELNVEDVNFGGKVEIEQCTQA